MLSNGRRLELLESLARPRERPVDLENMRELDVARRVSAALRRATEGDASAETILAAQRIAERLIGAGGEISPDLADLLRSVLDREVAPA